MKKTAFLLAIVVLLAPISLFADDAKATFEAKCKMCHGADLSKKPIDLSKSEADLVKHLTTDAKHKSKVADEAAAKALVAYLKTLKK
jgi:cytochrome c553